MAVKTAIFLYKSNYATVKLVPAVTVVPEKS